eukprot:m.333795 g.333795  ORF g.333795 m.333795 type:complete len:68 (-) comp17224_c0_seq1:90-293(-)
MSGYAKTFFGRVGSFMPVVHTMVISGTLGYYLEYDHIKHEYAHGDGAGAEPGYKAVFGNKSKFAAAH